MPETELKIRIPAFNQTGDGSVGYERTIRPFR